MMCTLDALNGRDNYVVIVVSFFNSTRPTYLFIGAPLGLSSGIEINKLSIPNFIKEVMKTSRWN